MKKVILLVWVNCLPVILFRCGGRIDSLKMIKGEYDHGIPAKRGHWIVKIELYNILCNGITYLTLQQELRFHIKVLVL